MQFVSYPPEVNSALIYTGAGSAPLLAAAEAWDALANELNSAAATYQAITGELITGPWLGPASESMGAAAASYAEWLSATAFRAEQSSAQANAAAAAYQTALSATVPPPTVAANRSLLATLIATNVLGRNSQAIAATEAAYGEMWAQDLAAMYGYAATSASSTLLTPFDPPPQTTNPAGAADLAVAEANGVAESSARQAISAAANELPGAAAADEGLEFLVILADILTVFLAVPAFYSLFIAVPANVLGVIGFPVSVVGVGAGLHTDEIISGWNGEEPFPGTAPAPVTSFPAPLLNLPAGTVPPPGVEAGMGGSSLVGKLSVPLTWTVATPAVRPVAWVLGGTAAGNDAVPDADIASGGTLSEMALAAMAGRVVAASVGAGAARAARGSCAAVGSARTASLRAASAADADTVPREGPRPVVTGVAAELREFAKLRDEGLLTDDEYSVQKRRLLGC